MTQVEKLKKEAEMYKREAEELTARLDAIKAALEGGGDWDAEDAKDAKDAPMPSGVSVDEHV